MVSTSLNTVRQQMINWQELCSLTTSDGTLSTTARPRKIFEIDCWCDATQLTSVASRIPPENSKLHFPLIFKVAITNLGKYINIFFPQQWAASLAIIQILYAHWSMDGLTYICPWYSQHAPSPPLLYFNIIYVDAPCLWNIKMTMTGTKMYRLTGIIRETKQKVTWSSAHQ